jgi:hypothetical protein
MRATIQSMRHETTRELTACHDCGGAVSFSAVACPHCGSTEPGGPYIFSRKETNKFRIEERNDHSMVVITVVCTIVGALYGWSSGGGTLWQTLAAFGYGILGLLAGVPIAFIFNSARAFLRW